MSLIAHLGVSKMKLAYERYMSAMIATGHGVDDFTTVESAGFDFVREFLPRGGR
jgi:hypothetical protein